MVRRFLSLGTGDASPLSHYSYHVSNGAYLLCDLQGGVYKDGVVLTDPVVMSVTQVLVRPIWQVLEFPPCLPIMNATNFAVPTGSHHKNQSHFTDVLRVPQ